MPTYTAFAGSLLVASGGLDSVLPNIKRRFDAAPGDPLTIFEDHTGRQVDFELRGTLDDVLSRAVPAKQPVGPGRPKLGVTSREISLLPQHWAWFEEQPNGASAAIRRLVDQAIKRDPEKQRARLATDATFRFLSAMAGNLPGYEEATRALYAGDRAKFEALTEPWSEDIREYALRMADPAFHAAQ